MSSRTISSWPDDPFDHHENPYSETNFGGPFEDADFNGSRGADGDPTALSIDIALDRHDRTLACVYTRGLWPMGIPELSATPPPHLDLDDRYGTIRLAVFLAVGLGALARALAAVDDFTVPPYIGLLAGEEVQMWVGQQAPVEGEMTRALGEDVDTMLCVESSLWQATPDRSRPGG